MSLFGNTVDIVTLKGGNLKAVLEFSAKSLTLTKVDDKWVVEYKRQGGFLQVSGKSVRSHFCYSDYFYNVTTRFKPQPTF